MRTRVAWATSLGLIALISLGGVPSRSSASSYSALDLGTLGGPESSTSGINNSGQVVGNSDSSTSILFPGEYCYRGFPGQPNDCVPISEIYAVSALHPIHGFLTASNRAINPATDDLGDISPVLMQGARGTTTGVNDSGQVVGYVPGQPPFFGTGPAPDHEFQAFRTAPNRAINLATDDLGAFLTTRRSIAEITETQVAAINRSGQVVGNSSSSQTAHAFRTAPNQPINPATDDLGTLGTGTTSRALGLNDSGQAVGYASINRAADYVVANPTSEFSPGAAGVHAFRTAPNKPINSTTDDLGTLGGTWSVANGINASGQTVGFSENSAGNMHTFRTAANKPLNPTTDDLGTLGGKSSYTSGINAAGQVVGASTIDHVDPRIPDSFASLNQTHAFLYSGGVMKDLNDLVTSSSDWVFIEATGINDLGQIAADGVNSSGVEHAFLLSPSDLGSEQVPEPSTLTFLLIGAPFLGRGLARRRRRKLKSPL